MWLPFILLLLCHFSFGDLSLLRRTIPSGTVHSLHSLLSQRRVSDVSSSVVLAAFKFSEGPKTLALEEKNSILRDLFFVAKNVTSKREDGKSNGMALDDAFPWLRFRIRRDEYVIPLFLEELRRSESFAAMTFSLAASVADVLVPFSPIDKTALKVLRTKDGRRGTAAGDVDGPSYPVRARVHYWCHTELGKASLGHSNGECLNAARLSLFEMLIRDLEGDTSDSFPNAVMADAFLVILKDTVSRIKATPPIDRAGGAFRHSQQRMTFPSQHLSNRLLPLLLDHPNVLHIEPLFSYSTLNYAVNDLLQTTVNGSDGGGLWSKGISGEGSVVAILDSGLQTSHCHFYDPSQPSVLRNVPLTGHRKLVVVERHPGDDCGPSDGCVGDREGHGTHTAGTLAGKCVSNDDVSDYDGVAPDAKLYIQTIGLLKNDDGQSLPESDQATAFSDALARARDHGAFIHSNSWGCFLPFKCYWSCSCVFITEVGEFSVGDSVPESYCEANYGTTFCCEACNRYDSLSAESDRFLYDNDDFSLVFAAGNEGRASAKGSIIAPAVAKSVTSVGSSRSTLEHFLTQGEFVDYFGIYLSNGWDARTFPERCCNASLGFYRRNCCPEYIGDTIYGVSPVLFSDTCLSDFSARGPTRDGRFAPTVVAPGEDVVSSRSNAALDAGLLFYNLDDDVYYCGGLSDPTAHQVSSGLISRSGTSMAAPAVAGLLVLLRQFLTDGFYPSREKEESQEIPNPSGALLKALLINSADASVLHRVEMGDDSVRSQYLFDGTFNLVSNYAGYGLPKVYATLFETDILDLFDRQSISHEDVKSLGCYRVISDDHRLVVSMSYYDPPSSSVSAESDDPLVNQLNLLALNVFRDEHGETTNMYHSWGNGVKDTLNPSEKTVVQFLPDATDVCIYVYGSLVSTGTQLVAVAVSGHGFSPRFVVSASDDPNPDVHLPDPAVEPASNVAGPVLMAVAVACFVGVLLLAGGIAVLLGAWWHLWKKGKMMPSDLGKIRPRRRTIGSPSDSFQQLNKLEEEEDDDGTKDSEDEKIDVGTDEEEEGRGEEGSDGPIEGDVQLNDVTIVTGSKSL